MLQLLMLLTVELVVVAVVGVYRSCRRAVTHVDADAQIVCLNTSFFLAFLIVAKDSVLMGKSFTRFSEFQIFGAAWLNVLGENFVRAACDFERSKEEERSGRTGL